MNRVSNNSPSLATRASYTKGSCERVLVIGPRRIKVNSLMSKVTEDINFLQSRIEAAKQLKSPNSTILATYEEMLASRESILEWLQELEASAPDDAGQSLKQPFDFKL